MSGHPSRAVPPEPPEPPVPRSALLASWGTAVLRGLVSPDVGSARILRADTPHRVAGLPGEPDEVSLPLALGRLRALGVTGLRLALPVPGDASGLPGPAAFNTGALAAGEAVLTAGAVPLGMLPRAGAGADPGRTSVRWAAEPVHGGAPAAGETGPLAGPGLAEAERVLTEGLTEATDALTAMDVARWRPDALPRLAALRGEPSADESLPPGYPARAHRVLALARRVDTIVGIALEDPGAAASAGAEEARRSHLVVLAREARHAQVSAYNAWEEPQR